MHHAWTELSWVFNNQLAPLGSCKQSAENQRHHLVCYAVMTCGRAVRGTCCTASGWGQGNLSILSHELNQATLIRGMG